MKGTVSVVLALVMATTSSAQEATISSKLFGSNPTAVALASAGSGLSSEQASQSPGEAGSGKDPSTLQPGKALMLSAIMPGAGEYYAGYKWRAAAFFAAEIIAWTAVITYYNRGMDKDKEFKVFADSHFVENVYRDREFELARNPNYGDSGAYTGTQDEWDAEEWNTKIHYLPEGGFTHELPDAADRSASGSHDQQYYEMIGKYIHQFGFGWDDVFVMVNGSVVSYRGDDVGTPNYDDQFGAAKLSKDYMDMRYDSNQLLDRSSLAIQLVMLNHVASALHASFTVRAMKMKAKADVGFRSIEYDGKRVGVGGLTFQW